ncbi:MAG TPA: protein-disulfide reductase DsbD domain-containing protein [Candidatus Sulfopaludibacter sp.]|nr:protein-disulfide reductase DsbD domain-containing protein [Candidatus Sulfopaludibacter sp.]
MRTFWRLLLVVLLALAGHSVQAAYTHVQLLLSASSVKPGDTVWAGLDMKMDPGWHTYWKNPGAAGMATKIQWQLPPGVTAGDVQWPLPEKLPPAEVTTYGYNNEVMLLVPLKLAADLKPGMAFNLKANVSWLECKEECIPGKAMVEAQLQTGYTNNASPDAQTIDSWKARVPLADAISGRLGYTNQAWWEKPPDGEMRSLIIERRFLGNTAAWVPFDTADFFPYAGDQFEIEPATEKLSASSGEIQLRLAVKKFSGNWPKAVSGVIVTDTRGHPPSGIEFESAIADQAPPGEVISESRAGVAPVSNLSNQNRETGRVPALPLMLLYAFIGGLILNIMPCVLPVIALKILGFINHARHEPRRVRVLGLVYAAGVLASFLALASLVIGVKAAGHHAGWGMQFGSPVFIVCLTTLITLVALNLFGVFEVTLGGRAMNAASDLAARQGAPGAFFNGVLATALATPCTAPILASALGFAFLQDNPVIIVLIFLFVGFGLAAPYVVLSWNPAGLKFLPKPGAWMEKFKIVMGFPMLATAVWLFNLAYGDYGKNVLWLGIFLVMVALAAWIFGEFVQRGRTGKGTALVIVLILLIGGYAFALENQLHWRTPVFLAGASGPVTNSPDDIDWQSWSPETVAKAQSEGHPVLVDFTADWCLTCQVNKKLAIEIPSVRKKLKDINAVALVGDYTHFPDNITTELNRYNRAGVPLVLVYPKDSNAQPIVLPQVLTPGIVLEALDQAAR